jgi:hypothetical protein
VTFFLYIEIMPEKEESTWLSALWSFGVTLTGIGFAIVRYTQFFNKGDNGLNPRISRIEMYIYRAVGPSGLVTAFILMAVVGLYYTIYHIRAIRKQK